jgi:hypothetical protein
VTKNLDYCSLLLNYRNQQQNKVRQRFKSNTESYDFTDLCHEQINNQESLLVTIGDSWTWGDSLDSDKRLQQIYGALIAKQLDSDWINIGAKGWSNSFILEYLDFLLKILVSSAYKKIYFVVTLTENGRDLDTFPSFQFNFVKLYQELGPCKEFYDKILYEAESFWIKQITRFIDKMDHRFHLVVGQNFVWHDMLIKELHNKCCVLDYNWIECLADKQNLPRPIRTNLTTGFVFPKFENLNSRLNLSDTIEYKKWILPYIDRANEVNAWLDASPMNYKKASKHPNHLGHAVWADYILQNLKF